MSTDTASVNSTASINAAEKDNSSITEQKQNDVAAVKSRTAAEIVAQGRAGAKPVSKVSEVQGPVKPILAPQSSKSMPERKPIAPSNAKSEPKAVSELKQSPLPNTASAVVSAAPGKKPAFIAEPAMSMVPHAKGSLPQTNESKPSAEATPKTSSSGSCTDKKPEDKKAGGAPQPSQTAGSISTGSGDKLVATSKSDTANSEDSNKADKPKGPKTFDKETFVEAPLPAKNPWKKPAPAEPVKPSVSDQPITDNKKPVVDAQSDSRRKPVNAVNHRGAPPRSPRGAKFNSHRFHPANRGEYRAPDRHRKPLVSSKSVPATSSQSSSTGQSGECSVLCNGAVAPCFAM